MNRPERRMADDHTRALLKKETYGVLSAVRENGAPYGVPLNYYYSEADDALFFHCAKMGRKMDCIRHDSRVSFTVVGRSDIDEANYTTLYESVIVEGRASVIEGGDEKRLRLNALCEALTPSSLRRSETIAKYLPAVAVVRIDIDSISGKANRGGEE